MRRLVQQPGHRHVEGAQAEGNGGVLAGAANRVAALSPTPLTLYTLWEEYQTGIGGRKPAKLFTAHGRGRVKQKYSQRKVAWDTIEHLVCSGFQAQVATDRIYDAYGRDSMVTNILNRMLVDRRQGTVPACLH